MGLRVEPRRGLNLFVSQRVRGVGEKWARKTKRFTWAYVCFTFGASYGLGSLRLTNMGPLGSLRGEVGERWCSISGNVSHFFDSKNNIISPKYSI